MLVVYKILKLFGKSRPQEIEFLDNKWLQMTTIAGINLLNRRHNISQIILFTTFTCQTIIDKNIHTLDLCLEYGNGNK